MKTKIADDLMQAMAACKPGQSKPYAVMATMGEDGSMTLSLDKKEGKEETGEHMQEGKKPMKKMSPVMKVIKSMY